MSKVEADDWTKIPRIAVRDLNAGDIALWVRPSGATFDATALGGIPHFTSASAITGIEKGFDAVIRLMTLGAMRITGFAQYGGSLGISVVAAPTQAQVQVVKQLVREHGMHDVRWERHDRRNHSGARYAAVESGTGVESLQKLVPRENPSKRAVPIGDCFNWANRESRKHELDVHHALVADPWDGHRFWHAWVEEGGKVHDWQHSVGAGGKITAVAAWRKLWKPTNEKVYSWREAIQMMIRSKHQGPWHEAKARKNPPPPAKRPPANIVEAAEKAWGITFDEKPLGRGADGVVLRGLGSAGGVVAKFMWQTSTTKLEAALTDYIMQRQQAPATRTNPFRVLFPAVIEGLIISDRLNNKWLVTLREDVEPIRGDRRLSDAAFHLWNATDAFAKMEDSDDEERMERHLDTGLKEMQEAQLLAPGETEGLPEAIESVRDHGILLWDMHDGNWGIRFQKIPGYPPPGRMIAIDYGRSAMRDPDVAERALRLLRFHTAQATNPPLTPPLELRSWRRIRA